MRENDKWGGLCVKVMNDQDIIMLLNERKEESLKIIQEQYGKLIKRISMNIINNAECANECMNDVLFDVWKSIPPAKPISISSYVCMLSRRRTIDKVRKATAAKRDCTTFMTVSEEFAEVEDGLDDLLESINIKASINSFLKDLSPINREVFISRYFDFESISSISTRLHITQNSVKTRLIRMKEKLRSYLQEGGVHI